MPIEANSPVRGRRRLARSAARLTPLLLATAVASACATRIPYPTADCSELDPMPLREGEPQIERGNPHTALDGFGHYLFGLPSKLLLLDWRADNHSISEETEATLADYLKQNQLCHVKVRLNQYSVPGEWSRLARNRNVHPVWRFTFGALSVAAYTAFPQRLFGGDNYNPFTNTIHIYSDIPSVALHEAGHAKDFAGRRWKGLYALPRRFPLLPLRQEAIASNDAISYLRDRSDVDAEREAAPLLWGAYASHLFGEALPWYSGPERYARFALFPVAWIGKLAGWIKAQTVPDPAP